MQSNLPGIIWPAWPSPFLARSMAVLYQLEQSQWWPPEKLLEAQLRQLQLVIDHAAGTVPFYRDRLKAVAGLAPGELTLERWREVPILERSDIQDAGATLESTAPPADIGKINEISTSGSTGQPLVVKRCEISGLFFRAANHRNHFWHGRDFSAKMATIRITSGGKSAAPKGSRGTNWIQGFETGPVVALEVSTPIRKQVDWLRRQNPTYFMTYPSNLRSLLLEFERQVARLPRLLQVRTFGETLPKDLREMCKRVWNVPVIDSYSSQEIGSIALQCPGHDHYHVHAEAMLMEVLGEDGSPTPPGQVGQVIMTPLHEYAMPLLRYRIRDYAEVGEPCDCGRGLPVINHFLGRVRNMLVLPDGDTLWPRFNSDDLSRLAPVRQFQFIQKTVTEVDVKLVLTRPMKAAEEQALRDQIHERLDKSLSLNFIVVDDIPRSSGGKFEDFISEVQA